MTAPEAAANPERTVGRTIVIGAGQAAVEFADALRAGGDTSPITLIGDEPGLPYQRPPLSKDFLARSDTPPAALPLRGEAFYPAADVELRVETRVTGIDRDARTVTCSDGTVLTYARLVFATGARNRALPVPGADLTGVTGIRTLADASALSAKLDDVRHAVVIGAGFIGLEFAAAAAKRGITVTVIEAGERPMMRALTETMSTWFQSAHEMLGVRVLYGAGVTAITGDDEIATGVQLSSGEILPADVVVVGIGVIPNDDLAAAAGLPVGNGILVDGRLQTEDPAIFAIGDCCRYPSVQAGGMTRLESVQNATDHARHLAAALTGSEHDPYSELPWFWSQQGSLRLQIAGLSRPGLSTVIRGNPEASKFSVFAFDGDRLVCVESVNSPADHMAARRILGADHTPTPEQIADATFDLKAFAKSASAAQAAPTAAPLTAAPLTAAPLTAAALPG